MSSPLKISLTDPRLFGNDSAEDERQEVFEAHVFERFEALDFADANKTLSIARAYKGEGKSALLRLARLHLARAGDAPMVIAATANSLLPDVTTSDFGKWVRGWKRSILDRVAVEVGRTIGFAWKDDSMGLVEQAEKTGFKDRSVLTAILARIKPKVQAQGVTVELTPESPGIANAEAVLQRWAKGRTPIWLFVDDVDKNFQNVEEHRSRVAAFFDASREFVNAIPELRIRAAIRPNVWTTLKLQFEALSPVEQYTVPLSWSEDAIRGLLAKRIQGFLELTSQWAKIASSLPVDPYERDRALISMVFVDPMQWGKSTRPPHVILHTLAKHRPRWMVELCKVAAKRAHLANRP